MTVLCFYFVLYLLYNLKYQSFTDFCCRWLSPSRLRRLSSHRRVVDGRGLRWGPYCKYGRGKFASEYNESDREPTSNPKALSDPCQSANRASIHRRYLPQKVCTALSEWTKEISHPQTAKCKPTENSPLA